MAIQAGSSAVTGVYLGGTSIKAAYMGASKVWPPYIEVIEDISYTTETRKNTSQWNDYKKVLVKGVPGKRKVYKKQDGTVVKTEILQEPVKEVIEIGTKNPTSYQTRYETEKIPYETKTITLTVTGSTATGTPVCHLPDQSGSVARGSSLKHPAGEYGEKELKYEYRYYKNQYKSKRLLSERITKNPVNEVIYVCKYNYEV